MRQAVAAGSSGRRLEDFRREPREQFFKKVAIDIVAFVFAFREARRKLELIE